MTDDPWAAFTKKPSVSNNTDDPWASFTSKPTENVQSPKEQSYSKDLAYGLENDILRGSSNTLNQYGYPNAAIALAKTADLVHKAAGLDAYSPDGGDKSLGGRVSNIGHTLAQGAPGMAQDIAAGAAGAAMGGPLAPVTGLMGFGGSYALRHLGEVQDRIRESAGKGPDSELTTGEQLRAGGTLLADTLLNRFGVGKVLKPGPVKAVGLKAAPEIAAKTAEGVATGAGVGAGQTVLDSVALDQKLPSFSDLAVSGLTGAAAGAVGGLPNVAKESLRAARFKELGNLDPQSRSDVTNVLEKNKGDFNATKQYYLDEISKAKKDLDPVTQDYIDKEVIAFKNGQRVDTEKLAEVTKVDPVAGRALQNLDTLSAMQGMNNGGLSGTGFGRMVEPFGSKFTNVMDLGSIGTLMFGHHLPYLGAASPYIAGGLLAGQGLGYGITRGLDRLSGASNPSKVIIDKFGGDPSSTTSVVQARTNANNLANTRRQLRTTADLLSTSEELSKAKASEKDTKDTIKAENALTRLKTQFQTVASNDARADTRLAKAESDAKWKTARESISAWNNNEDLRAREDRRVSKEFDQTLGNVKYLNNVRESSESASSSDTGLALKLASLKQQLQDKRMTQLGKQANIMRNSQTTEQARQDALLRNVGQQNRMREASEARPFDEMVSDPGVFRANQALARDAFAAQEQAQAAAEAETAANTPREYNIDDTDWGPSTSVKDRPKDVQALFDANKALLKTREKLQRQEKRKQDAEDRKAKQEQAKKDRDAKKLKDDETKAKTAKIVRDAEKKTEEATKDADPEFYTFKYRGQTIRVPAKGANGDGVENPKYYEQSFKEKTDRRLDMLADAKALTEDKKVHKILDQLAKDWTDTTNDPSLAYDALEDVVNDNRIPQNIKNNLLDNWDSVKRTWATKRRSQTNTEDVDD